MGALGAPTSDCGGFRVLMVLFHFSYLDQDGWGTLLLWIDEAKDNPSFLKELIDLLDRLPMTIERLKSNSIAKIVKVSLYSKQGCSLVEIGTFQHSIVIAKSIQLTNDSSCLHRV